MGRYIIYIISIAINLPNSMSVCPLPLHKTLAM